jgi:hypothetical protein
MPEHCLRPSGYRKTLSTQGLSPSQGAKSTGYQKTQANEATAIYDGRRVPGISTTSPPIEIFHPIFAQFIHIVNDPHVQPMADDLKDVQELMYYLSEVFSSEKDYSQGLRQRLHKILRGYVLQTSNPDGTIPDGTITLLIGNARIVILVLELKREVGEGGSDPAHQASLSLRRSWIDPSVSHDLLRLHLTNDHPTEPNHPREMLLSNISSRWSWALAQCVRGCIHRQVYCSTLD